MTAWHGCPRSLRFLSQMLLCLHGDVQLSSGMQLLAVPT